MDRTQVLVLLTGSEADRFRDVVEQDPTVRDRIELHFATPEQAVETAPRAEVLVCGSLPSELLQALPQLRWISFWSAGLDGKITPDLAQRDLKITNASGVHGPNIAEYVLCSILMFVHQMPHYLRAQQQGIWQRDPANRIHGPTELTGQTLGIVGLGRIGEALTLRAKAFGMRVIATKRDVNARYSAEIVPDVLLPSQELPRLLAESDHVCVAVPYTAETHHLLNAEMLAHLKPGAYLYNIARGKVIDEAALIARLQAGQLAGAGLDVFETEPLPSDSPLWKMDNVLITPHIAGITPYYFQRTAELFAANLERYLRDEPLQNLFDPVRGY